MEEKVLKEAKPKLEEKYCVRISVGAFDLAVVHALRSFDSKLMSEDVTREKVIKILEGACKLVLENFRNCALESEFYEKAYELRRALVEAIELYRDKHPNSQSWLTRVKLERDSASIYMNDFLQKWQYVVMSSGGCKIFTPEYAHKLSLLKDYASKFAYLDCPLLNKGSSRELTTTPRRVAREVGYFLDEIQGQLIEQFRCLLTVKPCHVAEVYTRATFKLFLCCLFLALFMQFVLPLHFPPPLPGEVVSSLTDVPHTEILPSINHLKKRAIYKTNQRVVNQEHVIDEIFEIIVCQRHMTTRLRGSFLLLGPPGVGKTEIAKAVAEHWYCDVSRLVEIDMSEYAEPQLESASCDLSEWSTRKHQDLWKHLTEVVGKRPYSVILLDKIDKASFSVTRVLLEILRNNAPSDIEGNPVDFSKSIIFMTSSVGANQLVLACTCFNKNEDLWEQFMRNPMEFYKTHNCTLKGSGCERVVAEAREFFSADLLDSLDKVFVVDKFRDRKAVARVMLRDIVREVTGGRFVVHASDAALDVLLRKRPTEGFEAGKAIKKSLLEDVIPRLSAAEGYNSAVVCVDTLVGTHELSFRFQTLEQSVDDWYFKQKDGTFGNLIANLRMKVESVYSIFNLRRKCLPLLGHFGRNFTLLGQYVLDICDLILMFPPSPNPPPKCAFEEGASGKVAPRQSGTQIPTVEEKEMINNLWGRLQENVTGVAKATSIIVDSFMKIIDAPLQLPDSPARHFLFLGLNEDARMGLIKCLTESLRAGSGKSFFTHFKLDNKCRGEELKKLLIEEVKERPCMVLLFVGAEFADAVLYRSLLEIFDKGTLDDGEGFSVDFRRTIVILTSEAANKRRIADFFNYQPRVLRNMAMNQKVKRFRTELLHRVDELIFFDPILPEHEGIRRLPKHDGHFIKQRDNLVLSRFLFEVFEHSNNIKKRIS
ncbi:hypothetical protein Pfo_022844 [Paulownia fortunei]|nr:hypothetical protein Pfo_022844 [Paulownia fortunei]